MSYPERLFKYLPSRYVDAVLSNGDILFRNFTYFKQVEGKTRGDYLEACHRDNPDNNIKIKNLTRDFEGEYDASFLNLTDPDFIYMFCTSLKLSNELYEEFECDACIEITDPEEFARRLHIVVRPRLSTHKKGLLCREITYYKPNAPTQENIKDATVLPFLKDEIYANQNEYRFVYGTRKAFKLKQQIVLNHGYDFREEAMKGTAKDKLIRVGSIADIIKVHNIT